MLSNNCVVATAITLLLTVVALLPFAMSHLPVMGDYLNHLARMHLLVAAGAAEANPYYVTRWGLYLNLAVDLMVSPVAQWIGVESGTKSFLVLARLLILTGAMALEFSIKRRIGIAGFAALIVFSSAPFVSRSVEL